MTGEFSKYKKMRKVVFKADFGKHYKKGETHYIHVDIVEKKKLAKVADVSEVKWKELYSKIEAEKTKAKEKA